MNKNQPIVYCLRHQLPVIARLLAFNLLVLNLLAPSWLVPSWAYASELKTDDSGSVRELKFRVLLDDSEIGLHRFRIQNTSNTQIIDIDANFKVTFLAIPFYRYTHTNREVWRDGCLQSIRSITDDNGDPFSVEGSRNFSGFTVTTGETRYDLDSNCVMTFAYWNKSFLKQQKLLNSQNGKWLPVDIDFAGVENIDLGNGKIAAEKYRIRNIDSEIDITVWYEEATGQWLSLESRVSGNRLLRYIPISI